MTTTDSVTIGTCSLCGGRVSVPRMWRSVVPPVARCDSCGATRLQQHGPIIPMEPPPKKHMEIGDDTDHQTTW